MIKTQQKINLFIASLNLLVLGLYILNFDLPVNSRLYFLLIFIFLLSLISILEIKFDNLIFRFFSTLQLPILSIIFPPSSSNLKENDSAILAPHLLFGYNNEALLLPSMIAFSAIHIASSSGNNPN